MALKLCEVCGTRLTSLQKSYCSNVCRGKGDQDPIDVSMLRDLVSIGATGRYMANRLGVHESKVRRDLRRLGIYRYWTHRRFKKYSAAA